MAHVLIGRIGRAHGLRGEVYLERCELTADELLGVRDFHWRGRDGRERELVLEAARPTHDRVLLTFQGVAGREAATALSAGELLADEERLPDPGPDSTYAFQLIGLSVMTEDGRSLGVLESILPTGANRVFIVQGEREWLIPATDQVVRNVDLERRVITVALPKGLEDL
jgi:16S rRNA processing protein RimM